MSSCCGYRSREGIGFCLVIEILHISIKKTITRRRHNKIDAIKAEDGRWLYDMDAIKQQATNFFSNLYTSE